MALVRSLCHCGVETEGVLKGKSGGGDEAPGEPVGGLGRGGGEGGGGGGGGGGTLEQFKYEVFEWKEEEENKKKKPPQETQEEKQVPTSASSEFPKKKQQHEVRHFSLFYPILFMILTYL